MQLPREEVMKGPSEKKQNQDLLRTEMNVCDQYPRGGGGQKEFPNLRVSLQASERELRYKYFCGGILFKKYDRR